ncbi:hypothetical protein QOZ80_1AG0012280 [Eleusine coracana subsp. coracana]|nr:hypothetical protein QOZ80_1AG0012280 [Eleusine coracana subsp. coracana]
METASKIGIHTDTPPRDSKKLLSARPPSHSGKIKLQLFPIDETIQKILQQEKHNPYLELILAPRKKISSVVQHLNTKWGNAQCAKGELILFPNDTRLDNVAVSEKWTIKDSCVAADVHVAVGSPSTFRLRYGWFGPNLEQQISESSLASVHIAGSTIVNKASDLVFSDQKQMVAPSEFPNNFVKPSTADNTNTIQAVDNQSKVAPLSWLDCISNISFGALLSEAAPSQDSKQLPSHNNSGLQQIPVTCDSFDAAIASLIARQQGNNQPRLSNPSLWEAEETCHAFSFQNQTKRTSNLAPGNSSGTATASVLGVIPEMGTDDQQCSIRGGKEELNTQTPESINNHNAKPDSTELHESTGDPEIGSSCSRLLSGTESLGLTDLLTNSMDAFQNFSIF